MYIVKIQYVQILSSGKIGVLTPFISEEGKRCIQITLRIYDWKFNIVKQQPKFVYLSEKEFVKL